MSLIGYYKACFQIKPFEIGKKLDIDYIGIIP